MRLSEKETNNLIFRLEELKYGHRLTSMQLAQKSRVSLDAVNRVENQLPLDDPAVVARIAKSLGISSQLLCKIAGLEDLSEDELAGIEQCLGASDAGDASDLACRQIGFRRPA